MISTNFFPNDPVPPVTSIDSCDQFTICSFEASSFCGVTHRASTPNLELLANCRPPSLDPSGIQHTGGKLEFRIRAALSRCREFSEIRCLLGAGHRKPTSPQLARIIFSFSGKLLCSIV